MVFPEGTVRSWSVGVSDMANNTFNPIRNIVDTMTLIANKEKDMISLSIGDPTLFGNLGPPKNAVDATAKSLCSGQMNGYGPSAGLASARAAVAEHVSRNPGVDIQPADVILCSGCSSALDLCISAIANPGDAILVPRPGFPLYSTLANGLGIDTKEYNLLPDRDWEVDLDHLASLIDAKTKAVVVNNPSNPCGSVYDEHHLKQILQICQEFCVPVIADEIYEHMVFKGSNKKYVPMASLTTTVPILSCGGITKRYLIPGWRLGWITIHDANHLMEKGGIIRGLQSLSQRIIGANTIVQGALPSILKDTPESFYENTLEVIEENARYAFQRLSTIPGLCPVMPHGAMYMMVGINAIFFPGFSSDLHIVEALVQEQSVFCLPGKCFNYPNYIRIVLTVPKHLLIEACERIREFCSKHAPHIDPSFRELASGKTGFYNSSFMDDNDLSSPFSTNESSEVMSSGTSSPIVSQATSSDEHEPDDCVPQVGLRV